LEVDVSSMKTQQIISSIVNPVLESGKISAKIKSQVAPTITLDVNEIRNSPVNPLFKIAKPQIAVNAYGLNKIIEPWGSPTKNYFPAVVISGILFFGLVGYAGYRICKATK